MDGEPDNISFMIKRIKVHTEEALADPGYRFPGNYGVEKFLEIFSGKQSGETGDKPGSDQHHSCLILQSVVSGHIQHSNITGKCRTGNILVNLLH